MRQGITRAIARHLFSSRSDAAITLILVGAVGWAVFEFAHWAVREADWSVVQANLRFLLVGVAPTTFDGQLWAAAAIMATLAILGWRAAHRARRAGRILGVLSLALLAGLQAALAPVGADRLGGLLLSVLVTFLASVLSFPLGVLLALGRRSRFAALRTCCAAYIELMRSLPLLLVIYLIWVAVPMFSPAHVPHDLVRGLAGLVLFFCAYVAEYVRSGLQSVPRGQLDAARALGLGAFGVNRYIVFPQALRVIVPTMAGSVLDVFNATPLLFIIGMTDLLRAGQLVLASSAYNGKDLEIYVVLMGVYFAIGSVLTFACRRLEAAADGTRQRRNPSIHGG